MTLQPQEVTIFFNNWLKLLAFVNDKHKLVKDFGHPESPVGLQYEAIVKLKTKLWENVSIIDEYIDTVWDLPRSDIQVLKGWKNKIEGTFVIVRHLKKYSVFLDDTNDLLYGVIGITNSISEIITPDVLPMMVKTVLLPFGDQIIYDSIFHVHNVQFGPNIRRNCKEQYSEIKEKKGIISTLSQTST
jgi:hypothetical protein